MSIHVIAGLGNPGPEYTNTRHNVGFRAVDALAESCNETWREWRQGSQHAALTCRLTHNGRSILLAKPQTYMNNSGQVLGEIQRYHKLKPQDFTVVFDEAQLPLGQTRLTLNGGDGGHNGLADIIQRMGSGVARLRIGIGPKTHPMMDIKDFVLGKFTTEEQNQLEKKMANIVAGLRLLVDNGPVLAMNQINQREKPTAHERSNPQILQNHDHPGHQGI